MATTTIPLPPPPRCLRRAIIMKIVIIKIVIITKDSMKYWILLTNCFVRLSKSFPGPNCNRCTFCCPAWTNKTTVGSQGTPGGSKPHPLPRSVSVDFPTNLCCWISQKERPALVRVPSKLSLNRPQTWEVAHECLTWKESLLSNQVTAMQAPQVPYNWISMYKHHLCIFLSSTSIMYYHVLCLFFLCIFFCKHATPFWCYKNIKTSHRPPATTKTCFFQLPSICTLIPPCNRLLFARRAEGWMCFGALGKKSYFEESCTACT